MTPEASCAPGARGGLGPLLRAMRPRQWLKNLLVFVPLLAGHVLTPDTLLQALAVFATFCLCASSAYLLNDALDAGHDRLHKTKRHRPMAAGTLSLAAGRGASALLAIAALSAAALQGRAFFIALCTYFVSTLLYSFFIKRVSGLDVVALASLYVLRIVGGGVATGVAASPWLLGFAFLLFLGLALLKRHSELADLRAAGKQQVPGRGYRTGSTGLVGAMGLLASAGAVAVFAAYAGSDAAARLYAEPARLWYAVPLLLAWLGRLWRRSYTRRIHEDPLFFVSKDPASLLIIALCIGVVFAAVG